MDRTQLIGLVEKYNWYHQIDLGQGVITPGLPIEPKQRRVIDYIERIDFAGKRVIDFGCANGLISLAAERQGAAEVIAVDHTRSNIDCLEQVVIPALNSKIKPRYANFFDVEPRCFGKFDIVIFAGILYHLRYPFWALKIVRDIIENGGDLILETGILDDFGSRAVLACPNPNETPFKVRGGNACSFFNEKSLTETLQYFGFDVQSKVASNPPARRFLKKLTGVFIPSYFPVSNIIMHLKYDEEGQNKYLRNF